MNLSRHFRRFCVRLAAAVALVGGVAGAAFGAVVASPATQPVSGPFAAATRDIRSESTPGATHGASWRQGADAEDAASAPGAQEPQARPHVSLPVPAAIWMFGSGLGALGLARRRLRMRQDAKRPTAARAARSIPPRHHAMRMALRERMRQAAAANAAASSQAAGIDGRMPSGADGRNGPRGAAADSFLARRFEELALALAEQPDVKCGRGFGLACLKLGKRPFVALDDRCHEGIAFRVGEASAAHLLDEMPQLDYWNPKQERQPKRSWLLSNTANGEVLVHLAAAAYEQALKDAAARSTDRSLETEGP
ncbi:MAG TPA: hypothetical protein VMC81_11305 [Rhodocyclaceae bacterium]|nr:hypothetical protein [Rhodocyclaceae bacterium]